MEPRKIPYYSLIPLPFSNPLIRIGMVWGPAYGAGGGPAFWILGVQVRRNSDLGNPSFFNGPAVGNQPPKMSPGKVGTWQEGMEGQGLDFCMIFCCYPKYPEIRPQDWRHFEDQCTLRHAGS